MTFDIPEGLSTIGRSQDNTIVLDVPDVSRRHARLERSGNHLRIYDLNSTNGTRINGEAIHISDVQEGDEIRIGSATLELVGGQAWGGGRYP
jgi:pSer/pThr/pTyr-binding forkhead associated (FHA) protein